MSVLPLRRQSLACSLFLACLTVAGCGGSEKLETGTVTGKVTIDGQPAPGLTVMYLPQAKDLQSKGGALVGGVSTGQTDAEGRFALMYIDGSKGAVVGTHRVQVSRNEGDVNAPPGPPIPESYNTASSITREVKKGANDGQDIEIKTK